MKRRVDVTVMGMNFPVRTDRDDAWVHQLAGLVTRRLDELKRNAKTASSQQLAVLLALNMAEELQLEREKNAELQKLAKSTLQKVNDALSALDDADSDEDVDVDNDRVVAEA